MPAPEPILYREKVAWHSIAALLLITFGILLSVLMPNTKGLQSIASDQLKVVELQDGSQLTLNANTLVTTQWSKKAREIWLHRGDVIVKVKHDERPLIVHIQNVDITAIGTEFLVSSRSTGPEVSVLEGAVQMTLSEDSPQPLWDFNRDSFFNNKPDSLLLRAGESGRVDAGRSRLIKNPAADVQGKISWRDGLLIFASTDLSEAIDQVMRHSNMKINLKHPALAELTVSGVFKAGETEEFLNAIHQQLPVEAIRYSSNWVVVRAR
jgi:transmembrane sensor